MRRRSIIDTADSSNHISLIDNYRNSRRKTSLRGDKLPRNPPEDAAQWRRAAPSHASLFSIQLKEIHTKWFGMQGVASRWPHPARAACCRNGNQAKSLQGRRERPRPRPSAVNTPTQYSNNSVGAEATDGAADGSDPSGKRSHAMIPVIMACSLLHFQVFNH